MPSPKGPILWMTPDPHHTYGYSGFTPQLKFQIGDTFSRTTNRLLNDPNVASSGRLVLTDIHLPPLKGRGSLIVDESRQKEIIGNRLDRCGNQILVENMVPGYTGFVPKRERYFGKRYAVNCNKAIYDLEMETRALKRKRRSVSLLSQRRQGEKDTVYQAPLKPVAEKAKPYISQYSGKYAKSPLYLNNDDPLKSYMSGYTGFVPRYRGQLGSGYPLTTHIALNEFTDDIKRQAQLVKKPIVIERPEPKIVNPVRIYPVHTGLLPNYTGHIPGQKFRQGQTFGHSTKNALQRAF